MRRITTTTALLLMLALVGCQQSQSGRESRSTEPRVMHVVIAWLKQPGDASAMDRIAQASRSFEQIPGVERVYVGGAVPSDRPVVDDSFDVGVVMIFRDRAALDAYQVHPDHQAAVRDVLQPLVARMIVYDVTDAP